MANKAILGTNVPQRSYIIGSWGHLFADEQGERSTRVVLDVSTKRLL